MAKRNRQATKWHQNQKTREASPLLDGKNILCPFCNPTHPLVPGINPCGTQIKISAVQNIFRNRTCALCNKTGGEMICVNNIYVHAHMCTPGKFIYAVPPKPSAVAGLFYKSPEWCTLITKRIFGIVPVEVTAQDKSAPASYAWEKVRRSKP